MDVSTHLVCSLLLFIQAATGIYILDEESKHLTNKQFSFPVMGHYLPQGKHLKTKRLLRKLGGEFNVAWLSVDTPRSSNYVPDSDATEKGTEGNDIKIWLDNTRQARLIDKHSVDLALNNRTKQTIKTFMQRMTKCQITFEWKDMGSLFWPRHIKTGNCATGASCSWPTGMICQSTEEKILHVLHWRCTRHKHPNKRKVSNSKHTIDNNNNENTNTRNLLDAFKRKLKCRWKKIPYEVTTKCGCFC